MKPLMTVLLCIISFPVFSQTGALPLKEWTGQPGSPLVLYMSGDGGMNAFSTQLCEALNKAGYHVAAINSRTYFWQKKTPEQATAAITAYLQQYFQHQGSRRLLLVGYSFGADVIPFIINRLPATLHLELGSTFLLSPSGSTDFEIHLSDMMGGNKKRSMDVAAEINQLKTSKTVLVFGDGEDVFPVKQVTLPSVIKENLPGGHDFDGNTEEVVRLMKKYL